MLEIIYNTFSPFWSKAGLWTAGFALVVLLPFFIFVNAGWPGGPDECLTEKSVQPSAKHNTCYCELIDVDAVLHNKPGVRQFFNTWSNLYIIVTALILLIWVSGSPTTNSDSDPNLMRSTEFYPIFYIQVAVFLALGSMWFHASIVWWGGIFDQMSMYTLVSFLLAYSLIRIFGPPLYVFLILYAMCLITYFALACIGASSETVIEVSMVPYGIMEIIIWIRDWLWNPEARGNYGSFWEHPGDYLRSFGNYWKYWFIGFAFFGVAMLLRALSDTDKPLCFSQESVLQFHGIWHVLCGVMAVMLYFHWREARR